MKRSVSLYTKVHIKVYLNQKSRHKNMKFKLLTTRTENIRASEITRISCGEKRKVDRSRRGKFCIRHVGRNKTCQSVSDIGVKPHRVFKLTRVKEFQVVHPLTNHYDKRPQHGLKFCAENHTHKKEPNHRKEIYVGSDYSPLVRTFKLSNVRFCKWPNILI